MAPVLIGVCGAAVDFWRMTNARIELQEIADAAALAGAREFVLGQKRMDIPRKTAESTLANSLERKKLSDRSTTQVRSDPSKNTLEVELSLSFTPSFVTALFQPSVDVSVTSTAVSFYSANLCVLSLDPSREERLTIEDKAKLTGNNCSIHANSKHPRAILATNMALVESIETSVVGGYSGSATNFSPQPKTDYPVKPDPLEKRPAIQGGGCKKTDLSLDGYVGDLSPGVYCGGLTISGDSDVHFNPGIYIIKDGALVISGDSYVSGLDVGFYLTGSDARFSFIDKATVELSGRESGPMAGLLVYQDRALKNEPDSQIRSPNVVEMVGTIYLPSGDLLIDTYSKVAQESAYTAIVADELWLRSTAHLILNSDYDATDVPLPSGLEGPPVVALRH